jgi:hypothetical protein
MAITTISSTREKADFKFPLPPFIKEEVALFPP